jgi:mannose-6-phosphate isomerase-like protein (cupin superfamily)
MSDSSMARRGETIENPLTGERMTFLETARDTDGELLRMDYVAPPRYKGPTEHVHLLQEERFEVVSGVLGIRVGGRELHPEEGQSAVGPPGVPHK